jgi:hypothetical protein
MVRYNFSERHCSSVSCGVSELATYAGVCPEEVLGLNDFGHLQWIATLDDYFDKDVLNHVRSRLVRDTEIQFGKHTGTQLRDLMEGNSSYWKWLEQQAETNSRLAYIKYV